MKSFLSCALFSSAILLTPLAYAHELVTTDNTDKPAALKITTGDHVGSCSGSQGGAINPHETKSISWMLINMACQGSENNTCSANIYMTKDCSDKPVGTVDLHLENGIIDVTTLDAVNYSLHSDAAYTLTLDQK